MCVLAQSTDSFCKKWSQHFGLWERRRFVRRKLAKIAEICDRNIDPRWHFKNYVLINLLFQMCWSDDTSFKNWRFLWEWFDHKAMTLNFNSALLLPPFSPHALNLSMLESDLVGQKRGLKLSTQLLSRVTRLGEFSPHGWLFTLGSCLKILKYPTTFGYFTYVFHG
jgi:hypothetical protein